jgi:hypothetical protein
MEGCPLTIEDNKRHRYQDENLKVQRVEASENVFVQKDGLQKKGRGERKKEKKGRVGELVRLQYRLRVHCND